jgi:hypothetical protein
MRGGSPVRSTSKEVDDGPNEPDPATKNTADLAPRWGAGRRKEEISFMKRTNLARGVVALAAVAVIVGACGSSGATSAPASTAPESTAPETMAPESVAPAMYSCSSRLRP